MVFYASSKGIDNKGLKKRGGEITIKPFVPAQFRIPNSEFRIEPINPNLKFSNPTTLPPPNNFNKILPKPFEISTLCHLTISLHYDIIIKIIK